MNAKPRVVIIGAGFGGLEAAKKLACEAVRVTVVDRTNYHLFQPLLYQVATAALSPADVAARRAAMTFVVIGGGPTGVEMAGAIAEIARYTLAKDFSHIDPSQARVILVEGEPRVLAAFPEDLQTSAMKQLVDLGVEVRT